MILSLACVALGVVIGLMLSDRSPSPSECARTLAGLSAESQRAKQRATTEQLKRELGR